MRRSVGTLLLLLFALTPLAASAAQYSIGDHVLVTSFKQSYPGVVTKVFRDTVYRIRYDAGYGDYDTLLEYMRPASGTAWHHAPAVGDAVKVRYGKADYRARVIAKRAEEVYRVRYADGSEWDTIGEYMHPAAGAASAPPPASAAPVDYTFLGIDTAHSAIRYRIKVHTPKPIAQVDIAMKSVAANGKVVNDTTVVWQNIVKSKRQPIENGKTYEDTTYLFPNTARVESRLLRVVYADGTRWEAPK